MNRALLYLSFTLLKRQFFLFCRDLLRPIPLLSFLLAMSVLATLFYFRNDEFIGKFVKNTPLAFFLSLLLVVSLVRAFIQRGMTFNPPDIEFLFAGPFRQSHLIFYRLIPAYIGSLGTILIFSVLFWKHFEHPLLTALGIALFQLVCAHLAMAVSIFSGSLPDNIFTRLRWVAWGLILLYAIVWINRAINADEIDSNPTQVRRLIPGDVLQVLFYPHFNSTHGAGTDPLHVLSSQAVSMAVNTSSGTLSLLAGFAFLIPALAASASLLLRLRTNIFESTIQASDRFTTSQAHQRNRIQPGVQTSKSEQASTPLPQSRFFRGTIGALIWKNGLCALRSRTKLLLGLGYTFVITSSALALVLAIGKYEEDVRFEFFCLIPLLIASLPFLLQTASPFDLRLDGHQLANLRTMPVRPPALACAVITVPTLLCLVHQTLALIILTLFADFPWSILLAMIFGFPAITIAIHAVWNIYYAFWSTTHAASSARAKSTPMAVMLVLCMTGALLYPGALIIQRFLALNALEWGLFTAVILQYVLDGLLLLVLAKAIQRDSHSAAI